MATLRGESVDRPPVSFYEIGGWKLDPDDSDPYNVFSGPGWRELIQLAEEETDLIRMVHPQTTPAADNPMTELRRVETWEQDGSRFTRVTLDAGDRTLTSLSRRDRDVATTWELEHLLKTPEDAEAYLRLPDEAFAYDVGVDNLVAAEEDLGDAGIVMVDYGDPLCIVAGLFSMADYTVLALTEPALFHCLLQKVAQGLYPEVETVAREFAGHLWRVVGSEYASPPMLPPRLYSEYASRYTRPMVEAIQQHGGFARIHSHGRLRDILPEIAAMGPDGLDPLEPPPQGDMTLAELRAQIGRDTVLFGNIESSEIEGMAPLAFEARVRRAVTDGTAGTGRGFVLMPSACPYGRNISADVLANYEAMVRAVREV